MSHLDVIRRVGANQRRNLRRLIRGQPLLTPALGGMTLDKDDVVLAKRWLHERSAWGGADEVGQFEEAFARWNGSGHAFAFMGGRVALSACIFALDLQPGDEVIMPGYTCVVVPNAFSFAGVRPVFCDIELDTYGPDVAAVEARITDRTRAILVQHLYGLVCRDYDAIIELAQKRGLRVIEDCAQATGAEHRGVKVGNRGDVAFYSSEISKVFTTIRGGVAVTNDDKLGDRLAEYASKAPYPREEVVDAQLKNIMIHYYTTKDKRRLWLGELIELRYGHKRLVSTTPGEVEGKRPADYGCRMPAPIAALGRNQIQKLKGYNERRRAAAAEWRAWCEKENLTAPLEIDGSRAVYLRFPVLVSPEKKKDRSWALRALGVSPGVWFVSQRHPAPGRIEGCPRAEEAVARCINMPTLL